MLVLEHSWGSLNGVYTHPRQNPSASVQVQSKGLSWLRVTCREVWSWSAFLVPQERGLMWTYRASQISLFSPAPILRLLLKLPSFVGLTAAGFDMIFPTSLASFVLGSTISCFHSYQVLFLSIT
uniref:Uncharacterized protein n=1 Tax=Rousettus aegyptiacus TaxID=9407 RepID=A0A7J8GB04_ROUAE|nr:hypothetical protein HJG63_011702 [Rousettus aegyptiacus]